MSDTEQPIDSDTEQDNISLAKPKKTLDVDKHKIMEDAKKELPYTFKGRVTYMK